jgi:hypothetical protein
VSLELPRGTSITFEGTPEEVENLLDNTQHSGDSSQSSIPKPSKNGRIPSSEKQELSSNSSQVMPDILQIVNIAKSCPEAEAIEKKILENKPSETDRVLLPLYIVHEYLDNAYGLTTVEIEAITTELGSSAKINRQNSLRALTKKQAAKYVTADKLRKPGTGTRYALNDRGVDYMKAILKQPLLTS